MQKFLKATIASAFMIVAGYLLPSGVWAEFRGLPAHPLIIHGVVVLLPLTALFLLIGVFCKNKLKKFHIPIVGILLLSIVATLAARSSGYSLSAVVGLPKSHAELGNNLVMVAIALYLSFVTYSFFTYYKIARIVSLSLGVLVAVLAIGTIVMTYLVGHSGAESVWEYKYNSIKEQQEIP